MAAYKDLVGQKITKVTSNPPEPKTGQMWYNSTAGKLRGLGITTAWVTGGTYLDKVFGVALGGPVSAAIGAGGYGPPGPSSQNAAAEYDGSGWTSISNINTARGSLGSSKQGTQTAFWVAGGSSQTGKTEEWNGSSWSEDGDLNTGRRLSGTAGSLTAGLAFGGYASPAGTANSEEYNGTSWSEGNNLGASLYYNTGFGSQTAAISACGNTGSPDTGVNNSYQYDGTSWTSLPNVSYAQQQGASHGNTSEGFVYGGSGTPSTYLNTTSEWSGTAWSTIPQTLPSPARAWNGSGPGTSGLQLGGSSPALPGGTTNTNEFTRSTNIVTAAAWASGGTLPITMRQNMSFGTQTAAINCGGYAPPGTKNDSLSYDGTSWTATPNLNVAARLGGVAGTQSAGLEFGGIQPPGTYNTNVQSWNGSSWSNNPYNLSTGTYGLMGCGTQTAALKLGGENPGGGNYATTEEYDGEGWTAGGAMPGGRYLSGGNGIQTSCVFAGGTDATGPSSTSSVEYDGSSWTAGGSLINSRGAGAMGAGVSSDSALVFGGAPAQDFNEGYDGTAFSTRPSLATGRSFGGGNGTATAALIVAGGPPSGTTTNVEEFTGETVAGNVTDFSTE